MSKKNFQITIWEAWSTANQASQIVICKQLSQKSHFGPEVKKNFQITIWEVWSTANQASQMVIWKQLSQKSRFGPEVKKTFEGHL
jgi:hypothetical protein